MKYKKVFLVVFSCFILTFVTISSATSIKTELNEKIESSELEFNNTSSADLPSQFSWRNIDAVNYVTPIRNQSPYSSCETFAIVAALETMIQYKLGIAFDCDLSEAHLWFNNEPTLEWGSFPDNNLNYLKEKGIPDEGCWPYPDDRDMHYPNETCSCWKDRVVKITDWGYLPDDPVAIKKALMTYGPIPTYLLIYNDFFYHRHGIYQHNWGKSVAPHMVTIVGWDDFQGYWFVKNSWGTDWGDDGWFKIKYGESSIEQYSIYIEDVYGNFPITFVDDNNTDGPWDGTKEYPYQTIQEGIDNSFDHYAVYVKNGTYYENVNIDKTIKLIGESKKNTIIDGGELDNVINVTSEETVISGFTIQNSNKTLYKAGVFIHPSTLMQNSNITIKDNFIQNNENGIFFFSASSNFVETNVIKNNHNGISILAAVNNIFTRNVIQNNTGCGIYSEWGQSIISNNDITQNQECGIYLRGASNNNVIDGQNFISKNNIGIKLDNSNKNTITRNLFFGNKVHGTFNNSYLNNWNHNYWEDHLTRLPKIIRGTIGHKKIPWVNIDWLASRIPY